MCVAKSRIVVLLGWKLIKYLPIPIKNVFDPTRCTSPRWHDHRSSWFGHLPYQSTVITSEDWPDAASAATSTSTDREKANIFLENDFFLIITVNEFIERTEIRKLIIDLAAQPAAQPAAQHASQYGKGRSRKERPVPKTLQLKSIDLLFYI